MLLVRHHDIRDQIALFICDPTEVESLLKKKHHHTLLMNSGSIKNLNAAITRGQRTQ